MRFLLSLILLPLWLSSEPIDFVNRCTGDLDALTQRQKEVLIKSYTLGQPYELGYTLAAIAWQESCAGEYKVNFQDPSAGVFHTYIPGVFERHPELRSNGFMENAIGDLLVHDFRFAAKEAILELQQWKKRTNGSWKEMVKSYNKGSGWKKDAQSNALAEKYATSLQKKIDALKPFIEHYLAYGAESILKPTTPNIPLYKKKVSTQSKPSLAHASQPKPKNFALLIE